MFPYNYMNFRTTPYILNYIYEGQVYGAFHEFTGVTAGSSVYIQMNTGSRTHHAISRVIKSTGDGDITVSVWEGATLTTGSTLPSMPPRGLDRRVGTLNNPTTVLYVNPTGINTASATLIAREKQYASGGGVLSAGASSSGGVADWERVLKPNTTYLLQLAVSGGTTTTLNINYLFYESNN